NILVALLMSDKSQAFEINIQRLIFSIITDRDYRMKKLYRIANISNQEYLAQAIYLGVHDSILQQSGDSRKTQTIESDYKEAWRMKLRIL
ncbi:MAG: hypothetical protein MHPSP_003566, partial [Paramarteilia canceri]